MKIIYIMENLGIEILERKKVIVAIAHKIIKAVYYIIK